MTQRALPKRINNWVDKYLRKPSFKGEGNGGFKTLSDILYAEKYYGKITELIPSLKFYKKETIVYIEKRAYEAGFKDLKHYYLYLRDHDEEQELLGRSLTLMGSHFFRGEEWDYFMKECLSDFEGADRVSVWCAGCSSGQEAYSVLLCLSNYVPIDRIDLLATDYNDELLEKCAAGSYFVMHFHEVPEQYHKYLEAEGRRFVFIPSVRDRIRTEKLDLLKDSYPKGFDIVLCRNVMKFFAKDKIPVVQEKLANALNPNGYLFVGNSDGNKKIEMIDDPGAFGLEQMDALCIYRKRSESNAS